MRGVRAMTAPNGHREQVQELRLVRGSNVKIEPVRWLGPGLPMGNVALVGGPPGLAKTTYMCDQAARVTRPEACNFPDRCFRLISE